MRRAAKALALLTVTAAANVWGGCATAGSTWMSEPLPGENSSDGDEEWEHAFAEPTGGKPTRPSPATSPSTRVISGRRPTAKVPRSQKKIQGKIVGTFRNTYYDFPGESEFKGAKVPLKNPRCKTIDEVPRGFFEAVCVQGSGTLLSGATVSFAKRDCECAEVCPRTGQKICFDELDKSQFPWGRGATGKPITPLLTVAVDTSVIPLGTAIYIPEFDGMPRDPEQSSFHDGCFIAQDRGMKVKGKHVDVFTGQTAVTKLWNRLMPSNKGVTVVLDNPRCARAEPVTSGEARSDGE
jgi:3D (Asp-Asp-Asp) domain-containing protein